MIKDFTTYQQALKLKALGFDEQCVAFFKKEDHEITPVMVDDNDQWRLTGLRTCKNSEIPEHYTAAPTFSQAFRFFREKHMLNSNVVIGQTNFGFKIQFLSNYTNNWYEGYKTYEEAELACLDKLIEIAEKK